MHADEPSGFLSVFEMTTFPLEYRYVNEFMNGCNQYNTPVEIPGPVGNDLAD
ncbi:MAG TPA: hypothetical protein VFG19_13530 [Geobacteraceae bacterium]|nr:hypothetical protein [Geobacteraceae bacterium]